MMLSACKRTNTVSNSENTASMDSLNFSLEPPTPMDGPPMEMSGKLVYKPFINKGGREIPGVGDYFLDAGKESWFIRLDNSKVKEDELKPLLDQKVKLEVSQREGLWDTDDPNVQSRIGKYIVVLRILETGK